MTSLIAGFESLFARGVPLCVLSLWKKRIVSVPLPGASTKTAPLVASVLKLLSALSGLLLRL